MKKKVLENQTHKNLLSPPRTQKAGMHTKKISDTQKKFRPLKDAIKSQLVYII